MTAVEILDEHGRLWLSEVNDFVTIRGVPR
jgi:hypothetical protein